MTVVANVDTELEIGGFKDRPSGVTGFEEKLFIKAGINLWNMRLAILAEVFAVCVNNCCRVVVNASHVFLVDRNNDDHVVLLRILLHQLRGVAVRDFLSGGIPFSILARTEIRLRKDFLETQDLHALFPGIFDVGNVCFDHAIPNFVGLHRTVALERHLY